MSGAPEGSVARADVERNGARVRVELADGSVRRVPLKRVHDPGPLIAGQGAEHGADVRIATASVAPGWRGVDLALSNGKTVALALGSAPLGAGLPRAEDGRPLCDLVVIGIGKLMTIDPGAAAGQRLALKDAPQGGLAIGVCQSSVVWIGHAADVTEKLLFAPGGRIVDARGGLVTPGLVEPHAHPVWGGSRAAEFGARAAGASYQEIAAAGGGIASTVRATRTASERKPREAAAARLARLASWGVTTCEAKSGYALEEAGEVRLLEVIAELDALGPLDLVPTLLAAHAVPPEARGDAAARAEWVRVCADVLPARVRAEELAESIDVFCDEGAFTLEEARRVLEGGRAAGLAVRVHADQLAALGASALAAELGALSVDHLEHLPESAIPALARAGTVAVCLPGAAITLGQPLPPARALLDGGVAVALGTDLNPGSSMTEALPLQMWLATTALKMSVEEAWLGVTLNAARAVARPHAGRLAVGGPADLVVWDAEEPEEIPYHYGANLARVVIKAGRVIAVR